VDEARFVSNRDSLAYYIFGREVGESGTPHLQCYVALLKKKKFSALKKLFPNGHLTVCRGTPQQNYDYCSKDGNFVTWGVLPVASTVKATAAAADRWKEIKELAIAGDLDAIEPEIFIKNYTTLKRIRSDHRMKRRPATLDWSDGNSPNIWYYGKPGVGKSRRARLEFPDAYIKAPQNKWWGGYDDEQDVIIDDLRLDQDYQLSNLVTWADRYPFQAEIKSDSTGMIRPQRIIVTSNFKPEEIWKNSNDVDSVNRRFKIVHIEKLEDFDTRVSKKRKVVEVIPDTPQTPKYRQMPSGRLVPFVDRQPKIDCVLDFSADLPEFDMVIEEPATAPTTQDSSVIDLTAVDDAIAEVSSALVPQYKVCEKCHERVIECVCDMNCGQLY